MMDLTSLDTTTVLVGLLVSLAVIALSLLYVKSTQKPTKGKKKRVTSPLPPASPKNLRKIATSTGSVATPSGRRSARIARKKVETD
eukprot:g9273.t1 g9273   contig36:245623-246097(-)